MKRNCYESYDYVDPDNLYTDPFLRVFGML
ncbi:Uncharacterised protein [Streptococcus pneumoniae]|nr:Uncharacterised protein [Streptococcus pneumoniae]